MTQRQYISQLLISDVRAKEQVYKDAVDAYVNHISVYSCNSELNLLYDKVKIALEEYKEACYHTKMYIGGDQKLRQQLTIYNN